MSATLVIGAGIAGMQAALDIADAGFKAYLVEKFAQKRLHPDQGIISDLVHSTYTDLDGKQRPLTEYSPLRHQAT